MKSSENSLSVLLVGDTERRSTIKQGLAQSEITLAGEIYQPDALRHVPALAPDVVVLDLAAREINTLVALQWLHNLPKSPRILAVGIAGSDTEKQLVLEMGADAYTTLETPGSIYGALRSFLARRTNKNGSWMAYAA